MSPYQDDLLLYEDNLLKHTAQLDQRIAALTLDDSCSGTDRTARQAWRRMATPSDNGTSVVTSPIFMEAQVEKRASKGASDEEEKEGCGEQQIEECLELPSPAAFFGVAGAMLIFSILAAVIASSPPPGVLAAAAPLLVSATEADWDIGHIPVESAGPGVAASEELSRDGEGGLLPFGKAVREALFQFTPGTIYFNHGAFGATPWAVRKAADAWMDSMEAQPTKWFVSYREVLEPVRARLAAYIGADPKDVVFVDNASSGMNAVLRSLQWNSGDILLMIGSVYPVFPNTAAWLQKRHNIRVVSVPVAYPVKGDEDYLGPLRKSLAEMSEADRARIRLALFDHISAYPPAVLPVEPMARLVKEATAGNALVFADGAHALGHIPVSIPKLQAAGVDFYVMDGHKWLFSPHGSGLLWAAAAHQDMLEPDVISALDTPNASFHERFDYIGTRDYSPWCAMSDALDFRRSHLGGEARIMDYIHELGTWAADYLADRFGTQALAPANMTGGLFAVQLPLPRELSPEQRRACGQMVMTTLSNIHNSQVVVFTLPVGGEETQWARISPQVYLEKEDFERLADAMLPLARSCGGAGGEAAAAFVV